MHIHELKQDFMKVFLINTEFFRKIQSLPPSLEKYSALLTMREGLLMSERSMGQLRQVTNMCEDFLREMEEDEIDYDSEGSEEEQFSP
mmetsp:Transcript_7867/g.13192  ORF Transcript_7867/g.13192 Transcript_7867/m.13192 type:complete len:88 (-) Transcript_7867:129-392(-)